MSNFRRRLMMSINKSKLPSGYIELKYIESTGTQYIDTGYIPTINTDIKTRASSQYNAGLIPVALFGYLSGNNPYNRYAIQYHKNIIYCSKGNTEVSNGTIDYTKMCNIETQGNKYIYNGIEMSVEPLDFSVSNNLSIILFARKTTNVNRHSKSKIEFFKIYENGVLVQYLIPCLDNNGTPCMYDTVSGKTFYNQGTGEFIAGPIVLENYFDYEEFYNNYVTLPQSNVGRYAIKLEPNTSYIVSTNLKYGNSAKVFVVSGSNTNWTPSTINNGVLPDKPRTITTDSQGYMCIGIYISGANIVNKSEFENGTAWVKIKKV